MSRICCKILQQNKKRRGDRRWQMLIFLALETGVWSFIALCILKIKGFFKGNVKICVELNKQHCCRVKNLEVLIPESAEMRKEDEDTLCSFSSVFLAVLRDTTSQGGNCTTSKAFPSHARIPCLVTSLFLKET
jgi:hypothetical protein